MGHVGGAHQHTYLGYEPGRLSVGCMVPSRLCNCTTVARRRDEEATAKVFLVGVFGGGPLKDSVGRDLIEQLSNDYQEAITLTNCSYNCMSLLMI